MRDTLQEVLVLGDRLLASHAREQVLAKAYRRNKLPQTLEALQQARALTDQLTTEYLEAADGIPHQNTPE